MAAFTEILEKFGIETVNIVKSNLATTGTNASGETSQSVKSEMVTDSNVRVTGKKFINVVETGRRPGKMPPVSALVKWLESGKLSFTGKAESVAWAIAKTIAKKGSSLFRKGGREDIITPAISNERVTKLTNDIADHSLTLVVTTIDDVINGNSNIN